MARLLSDGVCNTYLIDVWTASSHRRQGIASSMVRLLIQQVPGQHIGLQTDDAQDFTGRSDFDRSPSSGHTSSAHGSTTTPTADLDVLRAAWSIEWVDATAVTGFHQLFRNVAGPRTSCSPNRTSICDSTLVNRLAVTPRSELTCGAAVRSAS